MNKRLLKLCKFIGNSAVSMPLIIVSGIWLGHALGRVVVPPSEPTNPLVWIVTAIMAVVLLSVIVLKYLYIRQEIRHLEQRHLDLIRLHEAAMACDRAAAKFRTSGSDVAGSYAYSHSELCRLSAEFTAKYGFEAVMLPDYKARPTP